LKTGDLSKFQTLIAVDLTETVGADVIVLAVRLQILNQKIALGFPDLFSSIFHFPLKGIQVLFFASFSIDSTLS